MQQLYSKGFQEIKRSFFDDTDDYLLVSDWHLAQKLPVLHQRLVYKGRVFMRSEDKNWKAYHLELYPDRLLKYEDINGQDLIMNGTNEEQVFGNVSIKIEQLLINRLFLKKIKFVESNQSQYKFGFRIQKDQIKVEIFLDNQEKFQKWYEEIKRYCILPNFGKKYKLLTKMKLSNVANFNHQMYRCYRYSDQAQYTVRIVDKSQINQRVQQSIIKETQVHRLIPLSQYIVSLVECYEDEGNLYLVFTHFNQKDLLVQLTEQEYLEEKQIADLMYRLLQSVVQVHELGIYHRDIKLESIMFKNPDNAIDVVLYNFQLADIVTEENSKKKCGSVGYVAPEIFLSKGYDEKVDVFSLGVIFYTLCYKNMPFQAESFDMCLKLNQSANIDFQSLQNRINPKGKKVISQTGFQLLQQMLEKDPNKRISSTKAFLHTWFVNLKCKRDIKQPNLQNYSGLKSLDTIQEELKSEIFDMASMNDLNSTRKNEVMFFYEKDQIQQDEEVLSPRSSDSKEISELDSNIHSISRQMLTLQTKPLTRPPSQITKK